MQKIMLFLTEFLEISPRFWSAPTETYQSVPAQNGTGPAPTSTET